MMIERVRNEIEGDYVVVQRDEGKESLEAWEEYEFAELCDITRGASPRPIHDWISDQGIPWLKIADASATHSRYITQTRERIKSEGITKSVSVIPGDLILSNSATPGIPKFVGIAACIHDGWLLLRNMRHLEKLFCYYLLLFERPRIVQQGSGTVFTNLKTEILKRHRVKVPPLSEQRAIAHVLGTLDDKIELNRRMNETLEEMARALFKSWFVDFEPVRAKMEGRWCRGESLPGLPAELYDLFPDRLAPSELGEIPEGWEVRRIEDIAERVAMGPFGSSIKVSTSLIAGYPLSVVNTSREHFLKMVDIASSQRNTQVDWLRLMCSVAILSSRTQEISDKLLIFPKLQHTAVTLYLNGNSICVAMRPSSRHCLFCITLKRQGDSINCWQTLRQPAYLQSRDR